MSHQYSIHIFWNLRIVSCIYKSRLFTFEFCRRLDFVMNEKKDGVLESKQILSPDFAPTSIFDWIDTALRRHLSKIFSRIRRIQHFGYFWRTFIWTREKMKLTTQMRAEIETIRKRVLQIDASIYKSFMEPVTEIAAINIKQYFPGIIEELNPYKVRLENILCLTDIKEQAHSH